MQTLWMGSIQSALTHPASWGFHGNRCMFQRVTCGGAVPYSLPLSGKSGHVSLPFFSSDWARPGAGLFSFQVICRDKCLRPLSKILNCESPLETQKNGSKDTWQGCRRSETEPQAPFLLSLGSQAWLGFEDHEMKRLPGHCPSWFCSKKCDSLGSWRTARENSLHEPGIIVFCDIY